MCTRPLRGWSRRFGALEMLVITIKVKVSSDIAQYPVLRTAQSALHFTSLADLFNQTPSQFLWKASNHMLQLMREGCSYTYPVIHHCL